MEFFGNIAVSECSPQPLTIVTPLGKIASSINADLQSLTSENSSHFYSLDAGGFAARWELHSGIAEVIVAQPKLVPQYRTQITDCWAFLWRFKALRPIDNLTFVGSWLPNYTWITADGPNPDEHLDSQIWHDGQTQVGLGTEAGDASFSHSEANNWMPKRYAQQSTNNLLYLDLVRYFDEGIETNFGEVFPNELFQTHFAVAWAPHEEESISAWLAVDVTAKDILEGANGKSE